MPGCMKNRDFRPIYRFISKTIQDGSIYSYYGNNMRIGNQKKRKKRNQAFELVPFEHDLE